MLFHQLAAHEADTPGNVDCGGWTSCPNGCKIDESPAQLRKRWLDQHLTTDCPLRKDTCKQCCGLILFSEMDEHLAQRCIERIVECRHCAANLSFGKLESSHLRKEANGAAACVNSNVCQNGGCRYAHRKENAERHAAECEYRLVDCRCCPVAVSMRCCDMQTHVKKQLPKASQHERMAKLFVDLSAENKKQADELATLKAELAEKNKRSAALVASGTEEPAAKRART